MESTDAKTESPQRKRRPFQYRLRMLLIATALIAAQLGVCKWWFIVREQRRLEASIRSCVWLPESQRTLICGWVTNRALLEALGMVAPSQSESSDLYFGMFGGRLKWQSTFSDPQMRARHVYLFGSTFRENSGVIVLCDDCERVLTWNQAQIGGQFITAWVTAQDRQAELRIDAFTVGLHNHRNSRGMYRFEMTDTTIGALPIIWEPVEILDTHYAMNLVKQRVLNHVRRGGRFPVSLEQLPSEPGSMNSDVDGWGRMIQLRVQDDRVNVTSYGRDGRPGGTGDEEDIEGQFDAKPGEEGALDEPRGWMRDPTCSWVQRFRQPR